MIAMDAPAQDAEPAPPPDSAAPAEAPPEPPAAALPPVADGVERSLDPRSVRLERIVGWIVTGSIGLPSLITLLILAYFVLPGWAILLAALAWPAGTAALAWLGHRWPEVEHRHASYKVDGYGIEIRKGVYWRKVINVPRSRVQHTDVSQGPLERSHGLGTLVIYTAGTEHARVELGGLDHGTALLIRDHLLPGEESDAL
jgi:membrane protein YdbS with pleckstrin-like domain